jgi:hypothetical protein
MRSMQSTSGVEITDNEQPYQPSILVKLCRCEGRLCGPAYRHPNSPRADSLAALAHLARQAAVSASRSDATVAGSRARVATTQFIRGVSSRMVDLGRDVPVTRTSLYIFTKPLQ